MRLPEMTQQIWELKDIYEAMVNNTNFHSKDYYAY